MKQLKAITISTEKLEKTYQGLKDLGVEVNISNTEKSIKINGKTFTLPRYFADLTNANYKQRNERIEKSVDFDDKIVSFIRELIEEAGISVTEIQDAWEAVKQELKELNSDVFFPRSTKDTKKYIETMDKIRNYILQPEVQKVFKNHDALQDALSRDWFEYHNED